MLCVCACVCREGDDTAIFGCKGACSFLVKQMWTVPHNLTAGEVVLTTYMGVVLFLERPALLSAPRPRASPSYCTALQLRKGNLYGGGKARMQVAYDTDSVISARNRL